MLKSLRNKVLNGVHSLAYSRFYAIIALNQYAKIKNFEFEIGFNKVFWIQGD